MSQNLEINNSVYTSSIDPSLFQSVTDQAQLNSILKNMRKKMTELKIILIMWEVLWKLKRRIKVWRQIRN